MDPSHLSDYGWRGTDQGSQMKSASSLWNVGNGTNTSGWSALPGGYRDVANGNFNNVGDLSYWWTSSDGGSANALFRQLDGNNTGVNRGGVDKQVGKYVRCMKN